MRVTAVNVALLRCRGLLHELAGLRGSINLSFSFKSRLQGRYVIESEEPSIFFDPSSYDVCLFRDEWNIVSLVLLVQALHLLFWDHVFKSDLLSYFHVVDISSNLFILLFVFEHVVVFILHQPTLSVFANGVGPVVHINRVFRYLVIRADEVVLEVVIFGR